MNEVKRTVNSSSQVEVPANKTTARDQWIWVGVAALSLLAFAPTFMETVREWIDRPEYSHGFLMVPVAIWMLKERWPTIRAIDRRPSWLGVVGAAFCLVLLLLGEMKLSWFLKPYAFVGYTASLALAYGGWRMLAAITPALVPLFLACPLPGRVENALTLPLKNTAAVLATGLLDITGIEATLEGNTINLPGIDGLWVADACSGIRSLISLTSIAMLACVLWKRSIWIKLLILASCVPISIFVNSLRIWLTGVLSVKISPAAAQGFFHHFEGFVLFGVAALILWGWAALLSALLPGGET